ncbi:MAG: Calx-beta domain-containing protein [bacterium]
MNDRRLPRNIGSVLVLFCFVVSLGAMFVAAPGKAVADGVPSVRFGSHLHSVVEGLTILEVPLVISQPPDATVRVYVWREEGTATMGVDFLGGASLVQFEPEGPQVVNAEVQIFEDTEVEDLETIELSIQLGSPDFIPGSITEATVTIIDDDEAGGLTAHFELEDDDIPLDPYGRIVVAVEPNEIFAVDVLVDDLPPGGGIVNIMTNTESGLHTLQFTDNPRQTFEISTAAVPEGENYAVLELQILNPEGKRTVTGDNLAAHSLVFDVSWVDCIICAVSLGLTAMGMTECPRLIDCGLPCPTKAGTDQPGPPSSPVITVDPPTDIGTFLRYRDEILQGTPVGDYCIQLYRDQSPAVMTAILQKPTLIHRVATTWELWLPAVAAVVDGVGASFFITSEMQDALLGILAEFEEVGSSELADLVAQFRTDLDLENIAGDTAADLQTSIEDNITGGELRSWGELKAMYR